jgi:hypothetical protein
MTMRLCDVARRLCILAFACLPLVPAGPSAAQSSGTTVLDRFDDLALWRAFRKLKPPEERDGVRQTR